MAVSVLAATTVLLLLSGDRVGEVEATSAGGEQVVGGAEVSAPPVREAGGSTDAESLPSLEAGSTMPGVARRLGTALRARLSGRSEIRGELQLLDDVSAALEAGLPVGRAVTLALAHGPSGSVREEQAWTSLSRAALEGQELAPAWARAARTTGSPALAVVARAWRVASLSGAPLADALRVSAHTARERQRLERAVDTATAGARATATVLTLLPLAGVGLAAVLGVPPTMLYGSPAAWASVGAGAMLLLAGQVLVRRLVGRVLKDLR